MHESTTILGNLKSKQRKVITWKKIKAGIICKAASDGSRDDLI